MKEGRTEELSKQVGGRCELCLRGFKELCLRGFKEGCVSAMVRPQLRVHLTSGSYLVTSAGARPTANMAALCSAPNVWLAFLPFWRMVKACASKPDRPLVRVCVCLCDPSAEY